jgi:hypothetical protein
MKSCLYVRAVTIPDAVELTVSRPHGEPRVSAAQLLDRPCQCHGIELGEKQMSETVASLSGASLDPSTPTRPVNSG